MKNHDRPADGGATQGVVEVRAQALWPNPGEAGTSSGSSPAWREIRAASARVPGPGDEHTCGSSKRAQGKKKKGAACPPSASTADSKAVLPGRRWQPGNRMVRRLFHGSAPGRPQRERGEKAARGSSGTRPKAVNATGTRTPPGRERFEATPAPTGWPGSPCSVSVTDRARPG